MKLRDDRWYFCINLKKRWKNRYFKVHRLVASAFLKLDLDNKNILVCHKNDIWYDNNINNLFLWSHKDNTADMIFKWRNKIANSKKVWMYTQLGLFIKEFPSLHEASRKTLVNRNWIYKVCNWKRRTSWGYIWKYIQ